MERRPNFENDAAPGLLKFEEIKHGNGQFWATCGKDPTGQPQIKPEQIQMKGNERPKTSKWKEMKVQKATRKGNESPKGQDERKWRHKRPKGKEMKF